MYTSRLTSHRQVALPPEVLEALDLCEGDQIIFYRNQQGEISIKKEETPSNENQEVIYSEIQEEIRRLRAEKRTIEQMENLAEKD